MARKRSSGRSFLARVVIALAALGVIFFAVQGGEWGTIDLFRQQRGMVRLQLQVDSLKREVDSLKLYKKAIETDPALQEKVAREEFGMVRGNKELLYRFTEPAPGDSVKKPRKP
jgi:cell division protein FtsB